ncbi:MAG: hypothetical protein MJE68_11980, partial [Proteobacteria bacterium]|nr:hypothetical protein [Pseudomonadota bacterium]
MFYYNITVTGALWFALCYFIELYYITGYNCCHNNLEGITIDDARLCALGIDTDNIILPGDQGVGAMEVFVDQSIQCLASSMLHHFLGQ